MVESFLSHCMERRQIKSVYEQSPEEYTWT